MSEDQTTDIRVDDVELEKELLTNERIVEHPTLGRIRLRRPTPRQQALISEARRKQRHADLRDDEILSRAELEKIYAKRGMWSEEEGEKTKELSRRVGELIGILDGIGYKSIESVLVEFNTTIQTLIQQFSDDEEAASLVEKYFDLDAGRNTKIRSQILAKATSTLVDDLLDNGDVLRKQIELLEELGNVRLDLRKIQERQAELFMDSIEARAQRTEELARLYYCARQAEDDSPICESLEAFRDLSAEEVEFLMAEMFYFTQGITEEFKEVLGRHGFIQRLNDTEDSSDDSPDQPKSSSDGESQDSEQTSSGESTDTEISETKDST